MDIGLVGGPLTLYKGMAKTHEIVLAFSDTPTPDEQFAERGIRHFADIDTDHSDSSGGLIWVHAPARRLDEWRPGSTRTSSAHTHPRAVLPDAGRARPQERV